MHASSRWSEFRAAGGLWVLAQLALMIGITVALFLPPDWPEDARVPLAIVGVVLALVGVGLVVWAYRSLGPAFSPLTHPPPEAKRVEEGPYRLVRHPMYGGGVLFFAGLSLLFSVTALLLTVALALLWRGKSAAEERVLVARFPEYDAYRRRIQRRFLPGIY
jgi:protein-S-isoprenylcysteine O-methyltransferase